MPQTIEFTTPKTLNTPQSKLYHDLVEQITPGGVNSPFRSFAEVGGHAIFFAKAKGSRIVDIYGNEYIDYLGAWGPAILGHSPDNVVKACQNVLAQGAVFGTPHTLEFEFGKLLLEAIPSMEMVRFVNSGTEAVMSAVRLARGYTSKDIIIMFEGGYHGHSDSVLGSSGHRSSGGIPAGTAENTVMAKYNDLDSLESTLKQHKDKVAAVLIEPVAGSMGVVVPDPGFLQGVRKLCNTYGCLLIFDEVLTGLRMAFGGAQQLYGVKPDISCFGKALGGGMPVGAFGASRLIMNRLQPIGDVYQAGTFSGNPVTMAGGIEVLKALKDPAVYEVLESRTNRLFQGLRLAIEARSLPVQLQRVGSMFAVIFCEKPVRNFDDSKKIDAEQFSRFFHYLLSNGVTLPPSSVDAACVSFAHSEDEIDRTIDICHSAFNQIFA
jgi:glutamate-1-semialdehyde 2,1-aminomutase